MLGFDRGGSYPVVFTACRDAGADWLTWRRGALADTTATPVRCVPGRPAGTTRGGDPGRRDRRDQRLRPGPAADPVRARRAGAADPHQRSHRPRRGPAGLAAVPLADRERVQVPLRAPRHRRARRLPRRHRPGHHPDHQPGPRRRPQDASPPPRPSSPTPNAPWPNCCAPTSTTPRSTRRSRPPRPAIDRRPRRRGRREDRPQDPPRETARQPHWTPTRNEPAYAPSRRALQMVLRLLAFNAEHWLADRAQRLPARPRRVPRDHPQPAPPRRATSPTPPTRSPSPSTDPPPPDSPAPSPCSSTRSTPARPGCPATPAPSPTAHPIMIHFNNGSQPTSGGLRLAQTPPPPVDGGMPPELDQPGLVRVQLQPELREPLAKLGQEPLARPARTRNPTTKSSANRTMITSPCAWLRPPPVGPTGRRRSAGTRSPATATPMPPAVNPPRTPSTARPR